ncbi:MAG: hypothetical protein CMJ25_14015 [Phycisphaerae bacterium]|jgi:hypothetical protein|nr:hypothetical protein [Phycisphaerae bacterium]|tara:strand:- start:3311 stop:3829 length:519 start_codon:yes stop_codon:yes gene_type:complete
MQNPKATSLLSEILQKVSLLTQKEQSAESEEIQEDVVLSEEVEATTEVENADVNEELAEATEESVEETVEEETLLMEGYVTEEAFASRLAEMDAKLAEMAGMIDKEMGSYIKEKAEMSAQIEKLSAELASEPAAEPIKHSPESGETEKKIFSYGKNRPSSTLDRVFNRLNNK